jgi:membrane fusion protein, multidrug efflux system
MKSILSLRKAGPPLWNSDVLLLLLNLVGVVVLVSGCGPSQMEAKAPPATAPVTVQTILSYRGEIARTITLPTFRILPLQEATLYAKIAGYLKTLAVDKGDRVSQGQLLAEIEVPELLAEEAEYRAESGVARTNYERLAEARTRAPDLVVPQTVDELRGQWEVAEAKMGRVRTLLGYTRIVAPFSGVLTSRFKDPGAFVPAGTTGGTPESAALLTLMDYSRVRVQVAVPELEVPYITNGSPAKVSLEELPGRVFPGAVTRFSHALDPATKTMLAEIELANPAGDIRPGAYANVQVEVQRKSDALLLPIQAVLIEKAGPSVFVAIEGKARKVPVRTGFNDGVNFEITSGLEAGQAVILLGKQALSEGQPIKLAERP